MPKKKVLYIVTGLFLSLSLLSCASLFRPATFVQSMEPTWAVIEIREGLAYEKAWANVIDLLVKRFDLEMASKDDGYARTAWLYTWTGKLNENYRVRVIVKFSADKTAVHVKSDAEYGSPGDWSAGYDTKLLSTLKTDIMGSVGRMTR